MINTNLCFFAQITDLKEVLIIIRSKQSISVRFLSTEVAKAEAPYDMAEFKDYYIGGVPQDLRERFVIFLLNLCA